MRVTRNQRKFAIDIIARAKERLDLDISVKKEEINSLYYWIMQKMLKKVENCRPAQKYHEVSLSASRPSRLKLIYVQEWRQGSDIRGAFVANRKLTEEEFREIMKEVANIINSLPNFTATYVETNVANLKVKLNIP